MNYFLLFLSVAADVAKNSFWNHFSKNKMDSLRDNCLFNAVVGIGGMLFFAVFGRQFVISPYTLLLAAGFALVTAGAQYCSVVAMSCGSMSVSVLFMYLGGMLIPTLFGIVFRHQDASFLQWVGLALMILTVFFGTEKSVGGTASAKWIFYAVGSFLMWGMVGVFQQLQQESRYTDEQNGFLFWAFVMMTALFFLFGLTQKRGAQDEFRVVQSGSLIVVVTGLLNGAVNLINLYLSGHMESIIFFPIVNGGVIILAALAGLLVFREKISKRQAVGIAVGLVSVVLLGVF